MLTVSPTPWGFVQIYGNREPRDAPGEKGRTHTPWGGYSEAPRTDCSKSSPSLRTGRGKNLPGAGARSLRTKQEENQQPAAAGFASLSFGWSG